MQPPDTHRGSVFQELLAGDDGIDPEDRDEYLAERIFWVPRQARWDFLQANAKQPSIGKLIDDAMVAIEHDNPSLKGVLSKDYSRPSLDKQRLRTLAAGADGSAVRGKARAHYAA